MTFRVARGLPLLVALVTGFAACGRTPGPFDIQRARGHIDRLAADIGRRPVGSPAAVRARDYIVDDLQRAGFSVRLQRAIASDASSGITVPVVNIIAVKEGSHRDGIALVSHYDSAPEASGAIDDGIGVAVCLEAGRVLAASSLQHALFVVITDGEELGLMGARAAIADNEIATRVRAFLNYDGTGASGSDLLFEAAAGDAVSAWTGAASPDGGSFSTEIYRRLPNDTDFSVFRTLGITGLNFAAVGDSYAYHTDRDVASRVDLATLRHALANTITTVRRLDATSLRSSTDAPTFFDLASLRGIAYGAGAAAWLAWIACAAGGIAWLRVSAMVWRVRGLGGLVMTAVWAVLTTAAVALALVAIPWALRAARAELNPWYASPGWFFAAMIGAGAFASVGMVRLAGSAPPPLAKVRHPAAVWWCALPLWIAVTILLQRTAPGASYLASVPLACGALLLLLAGSSPLRLRIASALALAASGLLWIGDSLRLLSFVIPLFGWLPIVAPVWLCSTLVLASAAMWAPPLAAIFAGRESRWTGRAGMLLAVFAVVMVIIAWSRPAYTDDRPQRRTIRFVQDSLQERAWWELGAPEAQLGVGHAALDGASWTRVNDAPPATIRLPAARASFVFRAVSPTLAPVPADVSVVLDAPQAGEIGMTVSVVPREQLAATVVLPEGIRPVRSTIPGLVFGGQWRATYIAPPPASIDIRIFVKEQDAAILAGTVIVLSTFSVPHGDDALPDWVPRANTTWQRRGLYVVRAAPRRGDSSSTSLK